MTFLDTLKNSFDTACETINTVARNLIDKAKTEAKLNRLRTVMRSESELMNRAYIALGKEYYDQIKNGEKPRTEREEKLVQLIDACKAKIARARECYRNIVESQNEMVFRSATGENKDVILEEDVVDITVACSNENEYPSTFSEKKAEEGANLSAEKAEAEAKPDAASETTAEAAAKPAAAEEEIPGDELF